MCSSDLDYRFNDLVRDAKRQFSRVACVTNAILPIESNQMLVLRDNTENVKRMLEMIEKVDVAIPSEFVSEVIPIKFAKVSDIAAALSSLSGGGGGTTVGTRPTTTPATAVPRPGQPGYQPGVMQPGAVTPGVTGTPSATTSFSERLQQIIRRAASATGELQILGTTKIVADERPTRCWSSPAAPTWR